LIISRAIPGPDSSGGERRLVLMAALLGERAAVDVVAAGANRPSDEAVRIQALRGAAGVRVPFGGAPVHLARLLRGPAYSLILAETWDVAELALPLVRACQQAASFTVDTVDLHFLRNARGAEVVGVRDAGEDQTAARELAVYAAADRRIFVSDVERELYEGLPTGRTDGNVVVPIIVDPAPARERHPVPGEVLFVGPLWHGPNLDGITWFCSDVWPRIRGRLPDARLRIVGSNPWSLPIDTEALRRHPGVVVEGFVADLRSVYATASVAVAPLRFGAGMKAKVCDAMAAAVPVVTTTVGAEGIRALRDQDLLVADDPDAFADAVLSLLLDGAKADSVGAAGEAAIRAQCSADVVRPEVHRLLAGLPATDVGGPAEKPTGLAATGSAVDRGREALQWAGAAGWRLGRRLQARRQQGGR
jgi:glycosyltransferase involved in cell wall biosynthesis